MEGEREAPEEGDIYIYDFIYIYKIYTYMLLLLLSLFSPVRLNPWDFPGKVLGWVAIAFSYIYIIMTD